jgi:hypothetical protein
MQNAEKWTLTGIKNTESLHLLLLHSCSVLGKR